MKSRVHLIASIATTASSPELAVNTRDEQAKNKSSPKTGTYRTAESAAEPPVKTEGYANKTLPGFTMITA